MATATRAARIKTKIITAGRPVNTGVAQGTLEDAEFVVIYDDPAEDIDHISEPGLEGSKKRIHAHATPSVSARHAPKFPGKTAQLEALLHAIKVRLNEPTVRNIADALGVRITGIKIHSKAKAPAPAPPKTTRFDPRAAGEAAVRQMQEAEGGAWDGTELAKKFKLTPATLHRRRKENRIAYWRDANHQFHYPKWQFNPAGATLPGIPEVLQIFNSNDEWRVMRFFLSKWHQLDGQTPLDLLHKGEIDKVIAHAKAHAEENSW